MKLKEIEDLIRSVTLEMLGLLDDEANASRIRIAWPTGGAPAWKITEDVTFIRVYQTDDGYNRLKDIQYKDKDDTSLIRTENYTRAIAVDWTFYGSNSFDDADTLRNRLPQNETLKNNNLYIVYDLPAPQRLPELFNGQWWERTDFTACFYESVAREFTVPSLAGAQVILKKEGETDANITT